MVDQTHFWTEIRYELQHTLTFRIASSIAAKLNYPI